MTIVRFPLTDHSLAGGSGQAWFSEIDNDILIFGNVLRCAKTTLNTFDPDICNKKLDDANSNS